MKTDRLRQELARLDSVEAPELLPEIAQRIELGPAEVYREGPGPRTRIGRAILTFAVVAGVIAGSLVLTRVLPLDGADRERGAAGPIPENAIVLAVVENGVTRLYVVEEDGDGFTEPVANGSPMAIPGHSLTVSPDATRAAFIRAGDERGLWVSRIDGSEAVRLTEATPNGDENPAWSPDGSAVAFSRNRTGHSELFTINADGSNLRQVTSNEVGQDVQAAWSPDGASIVFTRNSGGPIDLWIVGADGTDERQLTDFRGKTIGAPSYPDWSPDGTRIVFAAAPTDAERDGSGGSPRDLWVIDADGTNLTRLTDTTQDEIAPRWSPDGSSIVFLSSTSQDSTEINLRGLYALAILELGSGEMRSLQAPTGSLIDATLQWVRQGVVADQSVAPAVVGLNCGGHGPEVLTPEVLVQSDGVLIHVEDVGDAIGVEGSLVDEDQGTGTWAFDFGDGERAQSFDTALGIAPGEYVVRCAHGAFLGGELIAAEGESLRITDPHGVWHDPALACSTPDQAPRQVFNGGELSVNPTSIIDRVIRHAVPGIADSDVVDYAVYPGVPRGEEWHFRVVRGDEVLARLRVFEGEGQRTIEVEACSTSGIGDSNGPTAGALATTRQVPGFPRCDPYTDTCASVWVSEARYAQLRGETIPQPDNEAPTCDEAGPDEACSTYPDDQEVELLLLPADGDAFVSEFGCGQTRADMCRLKS